VNTTGIFDPKTRRFRKIVNPFIWKGTSDVICVYYGYLIAFEIKRPAPNKTYATKEQKAFLERIEEAGGYGYVVRSVEEAKAIMEQVCSDFVEEEENELSTEKI
jgi:penicillin-binding protein-related factor A (putative recombinase)